MQNSQLSILVVDDAKFSSALIGRALSQAGYQDIRYASNAEEALRELRQRPAGILLADWLMPGIDGLELTSRVRQQDALADHYTYIMLLTGREGDSDLGEAFARGVDDFISKARLHEQLIPRVMAGDRLCHTLQRLLQENRQLAEGKGAEQALLDPLTGLGNSHCLHARLAEQLQTLDQQGGAFCLVLIEAPELASRGAPHHRELLAGVARRLQHLVRPQDVLARPDESRFALVAGLEQLEDAALNSFRRLAERLNGEPFATCSGPLRLQARLALLGVDRRALPQTPEQLLEQAGQLLTQGGEQTVRIRQLG